MQSMMEFSPLQISMETDSRSPQVATEVVCNADDGQVFIDENVCILSLYVVGPVQVSWHTGASPWDASKCWRESPSGVPQAYCPCTATLGEAARQRASSRGLEDQAPTGWHSVHG